MSHITKRKMLGDTIIVGFAMFAVFFGAGNLIFPPDVGFDTGAAWGAGLMGMLLTGMLLPALGVAAVGIGGGSFERLTRPIAPWFGAVVMFVAMITIAWLITIPRTAAVAYETGFQTLMPTAGNGIIKTVFLLVYFAVSFYFVIDRSNVIDKVGKYLTPVLLILMISIVIWTFADPLGAPVETGVENPFYLGFITGHQTGDVLTGLLSGVLFVGAVKEKGYSDDQVFLPIILGAAVITFIGLFIIYGGLLYLGATGSGVLDGETSRASLLPDLVQKMAGALGANVLAVSVMMACLTTAVGATAVMANYIEKWTGGRISYAAGAMVTTAVALFQAFGGVDKIVVIAGPIFMLMYPVGICIAVLGIFCRFLKMTASGKAWPSWRS